MTVAGEKTESALRQRAEDRLTVLRHELQRGENRLSELEREQNLVRQTVLRISGAIQVLEEVLADPAEDNVGA
jgi:hypothetical protein